MGEWRGGSTIWDGLFFHVTRFHYPGSQPSDHAKLYQGKSPLGNSPDSPSDSARPHSERRKAPRYNFVATAELSDVKNATKLSGRVTELSRSGCYVDILNVLPAGTLLSLQISCDQGTLLVNGKIVYVQEGIGMGVVFLDPGKDQLEILDSWLAKLPPAADP